MKMYCHRISHLVTFSIVSMNTIKLNDFVVLLLEQKSGIEYETRMKSKRRKLSKVPISIILWNNIRRMTNIHAVSCNQHFNR